MVLHNDGMADVHSKDNLGNDVTLRIGAGSIYRSNVKGQPWYFLYVSPTMNCQLMCVSNAESLLSSPDREKLMKELIHAGKKNMLLLDVRECHSQKVEQLFTKGEVALKAPYTNTRGTSMIIYIVHTARYFKP